MKYTPVIVRMIDGQRPYSKWFGYCPELPGTVVFAKSKKKCEEELIEAETDIIQMLQDENLPLPEVTDISFVEAVVMNWIPRKKEGGVV